MNGDQGDLNKAVELLYKLSLRDDFRLDVQEIRGKLGIIPSEESGEELPSWMTKENASDFLASKLFLLEKYSIPQAYMTALSDYIRFNKLEKLSRPPVAFIDTYAHEKWNGNIEEWYRSRKEPFAKIIVLNADSKKDVHDFIDNKWKSIQEILMKQGRDPQRIRGKGEKNKEIDKLIIRYSKQSVSQLKTTLGVTKGTFYKDDLIKMMLKKRGYILSDGYIRKTLQKYRH